MMLSGRPLHPPSFFKFYFLTTMCSMWYLSSPTRDLNPCPLHWELGVLTAGPPRKSLSGPSCRVFSIFDSQPPLLPYTSIICGLSFRFPKGALSLLTSRPLIRLLAPFPLAVCPAPCSSLLFLPGCSPPRDASGASIHLHHGRCLPSSHQLAHPGLCQRAVKTPLPVGRYPREFTRFLKHWTAEQGLLQLFAPQLAPSRGSERTCEPVTWLLGAG